MTFFTKPHGTGSFSTIAYSAGTGFSGQGAIRGTRCETGILGRPKHCQMRISGLGEFQYYMRVIPLYKSAALTICSPTCDFPTELVGAQATIDSTGKANDILRRVQARVPISNFYGPFPNNAIESMETICKRFYVAPPDYAVGDTAHPNCVAP